jgi:ATP-binding cassette subfamily F protein uup
MESVAVSKTESVAVSKTESVTVSQRAAARRRLSFTEQREFAALPARIDALEAEVRLLDETVAGPEFYKAGAAEIARVLARVEEARRELDEAYARWLELEPRAG